MACSVYHLFILGIFLLIYHVSADDLSWKDTTTTKKRNLRMSEIAKKYLSDENNPNNFPKMLGIDFAGILLNFLIVNSDNKINKQQRQVLY